MGACFQLLLILTWLLCSHSVSYLRHQQQFRFDSTP